MSTMNMKRILAAGVAAVTMFSLAACGSTAADPNKGHVYFLNGKPEVVDQLQQLAQDYTNQTGVQVDIQIASSGSYESTLTSELAKSEAPTMFIIAGYDEFAKYQRYLEPLQDTDVYKLLNDEGKTNSHKVGDDAYTMPYAAEWYGIIYNKKIVNEYAKKDYAVIQSDADIKAAMATPGQSYSARAVASALLSGTNLANSLRLLRSTCVSMHRLDGEAPTTVSDS